MVSLNSPKLYESNITFQKIEEILPLLLIIKFTESLGLFEYLERIGLSVILRDWNILKKVLGTNQAKTVILKKSKRKEGIVNPISSNHQNLYFKEGIGVHRDVQLYSIIKDNVPISTFLFIFWNHIFCAYSKFLQNVICPVLTKTKLIIIVLLLCTLT